MHQILAAQVLDMLRERPHDPQRRHLTELARLRRAQRRTVRFRAAMILTRLSLASATAVRRLDDCVADDLSRRMLSTDGR
jgi:hypothetical protein